ncbi:MAG: phosphatase PAP2 family protein [Treponema sp.]|jgi:membrane-associated phospholipid phosphatase|nr:phosphatase PAP2 family protein [Treponema sp.]
MNDAVIGALSAAELSPLLKLYFWGIDLIKAIQTIESPALTALMKAITLLGAEMFYLPILLWLFWCIDEKKGIRCLFLLLLSAALNVFTKDLLKQPRPFNFEPALGLAFESSYGIPSGHAQLSLTFWGFLASWLTAGTNAHFARRRRLVWACAIGIILLIAFTRLYLGVHFPTDILAGWLLGILVLILYYVLEPRISSLLDRGGTRARTISAAALTLLMNMLGVDVMLGGIMLGLGAAYSLCLKHAPFSARAVGQRPRCYAVLASRYLLGLIIAVAIALFLRLVLPGEHTLFAANPLWGMGSPYTSLAEFLLAGALGLWVGFGAPWCFLRTGLVHACDEEPRRGVLR